MRKIILTFGLVLLVGIVIGFTQINHIINFNEEDKEILEGIGIGKFEIRNQTCIEWNETSGECWIIDNTLLGYSEPVISSCLKIDDYKCKSKIYQKGGINKDIVIITKYCVEWSSENETIVLENESYIFIPECLEWIILTQKEIEDEMKNKTENLLLEIADIQARRNNQTKEILTDEIKVELK